MPLTSLGLASDVMVLGDASILEEHSDRFVLRSPGEPDFWFGNMVIFKDDEVSADRQIRQFQSDFPDARHVTIAWDQPDLTKDSDFDEYRRAGFEIDRSDVLVLSGAPTRRAPPKGITIHPLRTDEDWQKATELQGITGVAEGHDPDNYLPYIATRMETCRRLTENGLGKWFGAFDQGILAADLGIYANERTARFQAVETRKSYRRRGICTSLVSAGVEWAQSKYPETQTVIIAEKDGPAGRIYRRCGFELKEQLVAVYKGSTPKGPRQD